MEKEWFYTITQRMQELGLKGVELNLYAIIYGYSQEDDGCFYGTRSTLAKRCGVSSLRTIDKALESLIRKGFVQKKMMAQGAQSIIGYSACAKIAQGVQELHTPTMQNLHGGCAENAHKKIQDKNKPLENIIPPTPQEVSAYVRSRGFADPEGFADFFLEYCTNSGWRRANGKGDPITNWKNYIVSSWERNNKNKTFPRRESLPAQISKESMVDYLR